MDCAESLECTQELYENHTERVSPEQIGFLGICGEKHPVVIGPNKIGRDPQTCSIVLNLKSVSRHHAVINVLNNKEYTLMDLDSANKTKLLNNTLQRYIPHPLKNGDTVQFGEILGIFRVLEEDDELPLTQDIDIPEAPLQTTPVITESREVSWDDSFITVSHPHTGRTKLSSGQSIKPLDKTLSKQSASSPTTSTNNNSSTRSTSLSFVDNPNTSLNESFVSRNSDKNVTDNIHEMDTQPPNANESNDSIYTAETQVPPARPLPASTSSLNTQLPSAENLPKIRKIDNQHDMQFDLYAANKIPKNESIETTEQKKQIETIEIIDSDDDNYYKSTQDVIDDLCSTRETTPDILIPNNADKLERESMTKQKTKPAPKLDLSKKFEIETFPERILTRQRKPTDKLSKRDSKNIVSVKDDVKETSSRSKDSKSKEPKESKSKSESAVRKRDEKQTKQKYNMSITEATASRPRSLKEKENETKENITKNKSVSLENSKKEAENKKTRNKRKEKSKSPDIKIRRSKRHQTIKVKSLDGAMKTPKLILKNVRESTDYYNMPSSSGEPNRSLRRSLAEDNVVLSPKRTRSYINNTNMGLNNASLRAMPKPVLNNSRENTVNNMSSSSGEPKGSKNRWVVEVSNLSSLKRTRSRVNSTSSGISNASLRATLARLNKTHHVLFTAFPSEEVKSKLEKLGAVIVTDVLQCSVVLTMRITHTFKLLCAVGLGKPIVGPAWVQACVDTKIIVDPWLYLFKDESAEKRLQFNLRRTLTGKRNFLKGYNVSSTLSVQPKATEMKLIVECSGGSWREGGPNWVCVSCDKDKGLWASLRRKGAVVVSTEFILSGVLKQKLEVTAYTFP